jgi:hypothetical protein
MAMMFLKSFASRMVVSAVMLLPVRPGTLYRMIGRRLTCAMAL